MEVRLLNTYVSDHILVKGLVTKTSTEYSTNLFCDPNDPEETAYYEDELTPLEKGHYYLWKGEAQTGKVIIHMPFKIMDRETGDLLHGLGSYRTLGKMIAKSVPQRLTLSPRSCLQDFLLDEIDFRVFSGRVNKLGGVVSKDEINLEELLEDIRAISESSQDIHKDTTEYRESYCLQSSEEKITSEELLEEVLKRFTQLREDIQGLSSSRNSVVKRLDALKSEAGRNTDYIRAMAEYERAQESLRVVSSINFDRITREAIHKYRVDCGELSTGEPNVPAHIGSLSAAIAELKQWYPSLTKVSVHGDNVVVSLSGLRIVLTPDSVSVDGDPAVLKPYMEGATIDTSGNASLRRRRRNIVAEVKE